MFKLSKFQLFLTIFRFLICPFPNQKSAILCNWKYSWIILTKKCSYNFSIESWESEWKEIFNLVKTHKFNCQIIAPCNEKSAIIAPTYSCNIRTVQISIFFIKYHWLESFWLNRWSLKNLHFFSDSNSNKFRICRKRNCWNRTFEIKSSNNHLLLIIYNQCISIYINWNENFILITQNNFINLTSILKRKCFWNISTKYKSVKNKYYYLVKSKIAILFPTGLSKI